MRRAFCGGWYGSRGLPIVEPGASWGLVFQRAPVQCRDRLVGGTLQRREGNGCDGLRRRSHRSRWVDPGLAGERGGSRRPIDEAFRVGLEGRIESGLPLALEPVGVTMVNGLGGHVSDAGM